MKSSRPRRPAATLQDAVLMAAVRSIPRPGPAPAAAADALVAALAAAGRQTPDHARPASARAQAAAGAPVVPNSASPLTAAFDRLDELLSLAVEMVDAAAAAQRERWREQSRAD